MPGAPSFDDALARARLGDEAAWRQLIESIAGPILGFFRLRHVADPEDLTAEVLARVASSISTFEGDERGFLAWTFTIARRLLIDEHRRSTRRPRVVGSDEARGSDPAAGNDAPDSTTKMASAEHQVVSRFEDEALLALLDGLTVDQRDVVILRVVAGFSIAETALVVGKPESAVKQLQRRGLASLRRALDAQGGAW